MKNIFLDCGTHYGQGLNHFINIYKMDNTWDIYTFEANPVTYNHFLQKNRNLFDTLHINHLNKAVYTYNGYINFNKETPTNEDDSGMGSSLVDLSIWNPWNGDIRKNFKSSVNVECIDFSMFIKTTFNIDDNIIVKMDIEGAEFDVLEKMINDNTIKYIKELYIEFHSKFFTNYDEIVKRECNIKNKLSELNLKLHLWH